MKRMQVSTSPPWYMPKPRTPAATEARRGAPVVATWRAASVDGGVTPWSIDETRAAPNRRPIDGDGSSPRRIR
jgi:hypothetical protein